MTWCGRVRDSVAATGYEPPDLGSRTLRVMLMRTLKADLAEALKLRIQSDWDSDDKLTWGGVTKHLRDILGINSHAVIQALLSLK